LSHPIWSVPPSRLTWMQRFRTGRFGCIGYWDIWCSGNKQRRHPQTAPDVRQPSTELLKPTAACELLQPLLLLATHECGLALGPLDGPAADLADGEFRVVIAERISSQVVGDQEGVAVAATPTRDKPVHRVEVTT